MPRLHPGSLLSGLAVPALVVLFAACAPEFKHDLSSPQAAVRTYLGYLAQADTTSAYQLMSASAQELCTREFYVQRNGLLLTELESARVVLRDTNVFDDRATVRATVDSGRVDMGPFGPTSSSFETTYSLILEGAEWKLTDVGWPYSYCDFAKPIEPEPASLTPVAETVVPAPEPVK